MYQLRELPVLDLTTMQEYHDKCYDMGLMIGLYINIKYINFPQRSAWGLMAEELQRWRRFRAEARALALYDSDCEAEIGKQQQEQSEKSHDITSTVEETSYHSADAYSVEDYPEIDPWFDVPDYIESSDSDSEEFGENSTESEVASGLDQRIAQWAINNSCTRSTINEILEIFRSLGHRVPKDARTVLKTPRSVPVTESCDGQYVYFGIESGVSKVLVQNPTYRAANTTIELKVNIDGIPLYKSSPAQFWPILVSIDTFEPFLVALYYGKKKPSSLNEYLKDFIEEYRILQENGIVLGTHTFNVKLKAFICDAPARAFLKCIKGHTGYYACERCTIKGYHKNGRVVLCSRDAHPQRTEEDFDELKYIDHQNSRSPLSDCGILCIKDFALDYMHLVCLGVVKRLLWFLRKGPKGSPCRLSFKQISEISDHLESFKGKLPSEFARQPRTLQELERWKATEFRQFLLYTGPIVLRKVLSKRAYEHFLTLTVAISILLDSHDAKRLAYIDYARQLLGFFVQNCAGIYGEIFTVYNVHSLLHLPDDAENHKCSLNDISAFPFENYLQKLKRMVRSAHNPIVQVSKRLSELEITKKAHNWTATIPLISSKQKDNCFMLQNEDFAFVREKRENGTCVCDVITQRYLKSFFDKPCDSMLLNIAFLQKYDKCKRRLVEKHELSRKAVCLPYNEGCVLFPLLHEAEKSK